MPSSGAVTTVQFAEPEPVYDPADVAAPTGYVAAAAPAGVVTVIVVDPDCPGFKVSMGAEKTDVHPAGTVALDVKEVAGQPVESLLANVTV